MTRAGRVYIFFGGALSATQALTQPDVVLIGDRAWGGAGSALTIGQLGGDDVDDLAIGAPAVVTTTELGMVYVVYGRSSFSPSFYLSEADAVISGVQTGDWAGYALAAGDLGGDNGDDLVIGAPAHTDVGSSLTHTGRVYGFLSGQTAVTGYLSLSNANLVVEGRTAFASVGTSLSVGDVSGDGTADLGIGAPFDDPGASPQRGEVRVFFGGPTLSGTLPVTAAQATVEGLWARDWLGRAVTTGDINGDGTDDLVIGATGGGQQVTETSAVYVFYGGQGLTGTLPASSADLVLRSGVSNKSSEEAGYWLATGSLDGDGLADLAIGARLASPFGRHEAGRVYVLYGSRVTSTLDLYVAADLVIEAPVEGGRMGWSVASGDLLGAGYDDLAIGAPAGEVGTVYLVEMPARGVRIGPDHSGRVEDLGAHIVYTHVVTNLCVLTDTFYLSYTVVSGSGWMHQVVPKEVTVPGLATQTVFFHVTAPVSLGQVVDVSWVSVTSLHDLYATHHVVDRSEGGGRKTYLPLVLRRYP